MQIAEVLPPYIPPVVGLPGVRTLGNLLRTAMMPVGTVLYLFGGGWDWADTGSRIQACTLELSPDWIRFFRAQSAEFTYRNRTDVPSDRLHTFYPEDGHNDYGWAGLDCSGYIGWTLYHTLETENGRPGYVGPSTAMAKGLADRGWGTLRRVTLSPESQPDFPLLPGDIVSIRGHIWMSLGTCPDSSILILHSTPSPSRTGQPGGGVQMGAVGKDEKCQAFGLARQIMSNQYPEWFARYDICLKLPENYLSMPEKPMGVFSWDVSTPNGGLTDPDGFQHLNPEQILQQLFVDGCESA